MDSVDLTQFGRTIEAAVMQRNVRYSDSHCLSLRWEHDDTAAVQDSGQFQSILAEFNLPPADELIIRASDPTPGWTVQGKFYDVLDAAKATSERALVIVHYAGHGFVGDNGKLRFAEQPNTNRSFPAGRFLFTMVEPDQESYLHGVHNVDVLFILDCCWGFEACRAAEVSPRVVEFVAATDSLSPLANSPPRNTVTAKILGEVRRRKLAGHHYMEIADVVQTLRTRDKALKRPTHALKLGAASICLRFSGVTSVDPARIQPCLRAVFSVHIADNMTQKDVDQFIAWIKRVPEPVSITLDGMYQTGSVCLVLTSPWVVWSKLAGMIGYQLISETRSYNLLTAGQPQPAAARTPAMKENVPFGKKAH